MQREISATKSSYAVAVLGFQQTERAFLNNAFGLSTRRTPRFIAFDPGQGGEPNVYLVDTKAPEALELLRRDNADRRRPAILVGEDDLDLGWPVLGRPLQLTALFKALDLAVETELASPSPVARVMPKRKSSTLALVPQTESAKTNPPSSFKKKKTSPANDARGKPAPKPAQVAPTKVLGAITPSAPAALATKGPLEPVKVQVPVSADWILVCDDSPTVREFMRRQLKPFRFNVDYAESGEQAVGLTGTKYYACIFLDVVMPGIDGYQVCKLIKSKKRITNTVVIMLTAKDSLVDKIRGAMAGCDAYLTKPVTEEKLLEVINRYLPDHQRSKLEMVI